MKQFISPTYTFTPGASGVGSVNLSGISSFDVKKLVSIINQTKGVVIYSTASTDLKYTSIASTTVTLNYDTSLMSSADVLQVIYETSDSDLSSINSKTPSLANGAQPVQINSTNFIASTNNSTTAQLASAAIFTGVIETIFNQQSISVLVTSDQNGTLILKQYIDAGGTRTISSWSYSVLAGVPFSRAFTGNGNYFNLTFQNNGGSTTTTLQIDTAYGTLPATTNLGNSNTSLDEMGGVPLSVGQKASSASMPVTLSNENTQDQYIVGQSAQTALINNIIPVTAGATATDATGYRSAMVQVISSGTAGGFIFEGSNDNVSFQTIPVYNQLLTTGVPIVVAITPTASQIGYIFPVNFRYIRLRISTAVTGGSIQAFTKLMQTPFSPATIQVANNTAASLQATIASPTLAAGANVIGYIGAGVVSVVDQASAAGTIGTINGTAKTITNGASVSLTFNVTIATLTSYDIQIQESNDGTVWNTIWCSQRITGVASITTPMLRVRGNQYRYVEIAAGTSFTRTITSARGPHAGDLIRSLVDRSIAPNTASSVTPTLYVEGCDNICVFISSAAGATTAPVFSLEGSDDGALWVDLTTTVTGTASTQAINTKIGTMVRFARLRVSTVGVAAVMNHVVIRATGR